MTMLIFSAVVVNEASRQLAATIALVLKRADLTIDYVSRVTGIPPNKLSDQLAGKVPFTGLCRILASRELREETDFWFEWTDICAHQIERACVSLDFGRLVAKLEEIVGAPKRMAKASLPAQGQREQAV